MNLKSPDVEYSQYTADPKDSERCCAKCACYKASDDKKGICYEFEVLPQAGCKFFKPIK